GMQVQRGKSFCDLPWSPGLLSRRVTPLEERPVTLGPVTASAAATLVTLMLYKAYRNKSGAPHSGRILQVPCQPNKAVSHGTGRAAVTCGELFGCRVAICAPPSGSVMQQHLQRAQDLVHGVSGAAGAAPAVAPVRFQQLIPGVGHQCRVQGNVIGD